MQQAVTSLLICVTLNAGFEADTMPVAATHTVSALLRHCLQSGPHQAGWADLSLTRAVLISRTMCSAVATPAWINLLLGLCGKADQSLATKVWLCCVYYNFLNNSLALQSYLD